MDQGEGYKLADESRVNINNPGEAHYWCVQFQCSRSQLEITVREVGTDAGEVRRHLASLWQGSAI